MTTDPINLKKIWTGTLKTKMKVMIMIAQRGMKNMGSNTIKMVNKVIKFLKNFSKTS